MKNLLTNAVLFFMLISAISCDTSNSKASYNITFVSKPKEGGSVVPQNGIYAEGQTITVTGTASKGWRLNSWGGDIKSSKKKLTIDIHNDMKIVANFERKDYKLNTAVRGQGEIIEEQINLKEKYYPYKTHVKLIPKPRENWEFVRWKGDLTGMSNPDTITVDEEKSLKAFFGSRNVAPFNFLESRLYASRYAEGKVGMIEFCLTNNLPFSINLKRVTIRGIEPKNIHDGRVSEILYSGQYKCYGFFPSKEYPSYTEYNSFKIYWEFKQNDLTLIKIGDSENL